MSSSDEIDHKTNFNAEVLQDLLPIYYSRLFPYNLYYRWMSYGNIDKNYLIHREFSFTLKDDVYLRYQSFSDQTEIEKEIQRKCPYKIDIGAVYNFRPREHRTVSNFQAVEKELVFDIDMTDYDEVRTCCKETDICKKCWGFIIVAMKILDRALREDFGYEHLLWVYSGRRGVHCWVCDEPARKLSPSSRSTVAEYLSVVKGGEFKSKKVTLGGENIHPSIQEACEIINHYFDDLMLKNQDFLDTKEQFDKIVSLCNDQKLKEKMQQDFHQCSSSKERWEMIKTIISECNDKNIIKKTKYCIKEIMLQLCYPRLDINVTKGLNHLLKAPFCIHPKTGRVCVPIDIEKVDQFDPFTVPTISQLCEEIDKYDALDNESSKQEDMECDDVTENADITNEDTPKITPKRKMKDYKKTSLKPSIKVFEDFVHDLEMSWRGKLLEQSDMKREF